jgi:hypothetical protein
VMLFLLIIPLSPLFILEIDVASINEVNFGRLAAFPCGSMRRNIFGSELVPGLVLDRAELDVCVKQRMSMMPRRNDMLMRHRNR